ncbi:MAG: tRNA (N6-isopentenyl adenosine(37)-C2)-methylthiotransferase MiaB [Candidatus Anammoxibacter sp.]
MEKPIFKKKLNVFIQTFGCQMNKLDTELFTGLLLNADFRMVDDIDNAGIILYNTCSVRGHAEAKVYSHIGVLKVRKQKEPELIIGVLGCMAQNDGKEIFRRAPHVSLVCGTKVLHKLPDFLKSIADNGKRVLAVDKDQYLPIPRSTNHRSDSFQANVSIMRGCDNYCTYCIVPYVRGNEISREIDDITNEVKMLVEGGRREITLLGQNVNSYGKGLGNEVNLAVLLRTLSSIDKLDRIRFITSHPKDVSIDLLKEMKDNPKVCKYLHLPAQSGSDRILKKMNRRYTSGYYKELIDIARDLMPDISVSSDFIVGFPGESDDDFDKTFRFIEDVRFFNCFVFKYSPRKGTVALKFKDDVTEDKKKERNHKLLDLQEKISREENRKLIGRDFDVLVERLNTKSFASKSINNSKNRFPGNLVGRTEYNHIVAFEGDENLIGKIVRVEIFDSTALTLFGKQLTIELCDTKEYNQTLIASNK